MTELWFVDGADYLGTVIIRHRLTPALERAGGHLGYHVVPGHRRRGYASQMLAQARVVCKQLGLRVVLVTCSTDNRSSGPAGGRRGAGLTMQSHGGATSPH